MPLKKTYKRSKRKQVKISNAEGEGIKELYESIKSGLITRLTQRPLSITNLLKTYGNNQILIIDICRQPITPAIKLIINFATHGDIERVVREYGYDNVFHLYCIITLDNGDTIRLDKNQRVHIDINSTTINPEAVCKSIKLPYPTTLTEFITKGEKLGNQVGSFYRYSGHDNNCQKFIRVLLNASGVYSLDSFIMQDAGALVKSGFLRNLGQAITDTAALIDYVYKGGVIPI